MTTMQEYVEQSTAIETYVPISWKDGPHGNTPLSAENLNKMDTQLKDLTDLGIELRESHRQITLYLQKIKYTQPWSVIAECSAINDLGQMELSIPITHLPEKFKTGDELCVKLTNNLTVTSDKLKIQEGMELTIKDFTTPRYYKNGYMIIFRFLDNLNVEELALVSDVDAIKAEGDEVSINAPTAFALPAASSTLIISNEVDIRIVNATAEIKEN